MNGGWRSVGNLPEVDRREETGTRNGIGLGRGRKEKTHFDEAADAGLMHFRRFRSTRRASYCPAPAHERKAPQPPSSDNFSQSHPYLVNEAAVSSQRSNG